MRTLSKKITRHVPIAFHVNEAKSFSRRLKRSGAGFSVSVSRFEEAQSLPAITDLVPADK